MNYFTDNYFFFHRPRSKPSPELSLSRPLSLSCAHGDSSSRHRQSSRPVRHRRRHCNRRLARIVTVGAIVTRSSFLMGTGAATVAARPSLRGRLDPEAGCNAARAPRAWNSRTQSTGCAALGRFEQRPRPSQQPLCKTTSGIESRAAPACTNHEMDEIRHWSTHCATCTAPYKMRPPSRRR